ncbi:MAG: glycoside hydrolase family 3 C-terminal domain-containing protein [Vallitaleaceae bacterium]|nr:glycoside hydrolase family 3 C-terminal domain-containing protein [Vallitaleaceae bacterium]
MFNRLLGLTDEQINEEAKNLMGKMTLKEMVWLLNGNWDPIKNQIKHNNAYNPIPISTNGCKRLDITPIKFTDGPRGVVMGNSTCFPVSMARGASFDRQLESRVGDVIGKEARAGGANYFAGVCMNLLRHPAWGRAQETYSEDPFHLGVMAEALTESVQEHNIMACLKHYALNSIENSRFRVNVHLDERTLREVYLPHFKRCVDAGAASLMGAYNLIEGDHCCESHHLLTDILRDDWGFMGFTSSDFIFGIRDVKKAIEAGMDVEMPMPIRYQKHLLDGVTSGDIEASYVDTAVLRVLRTVLAFEHTPDKMSYKEELIAHPSHIALSREVAEKSMVLIKNEHNILPFSGAVKKVMVLGSLADKANTGDYGSSKINAPYVVSPMEGLRAYLGEDVNIVHYDETQIEEAKALAADMDCIIMVVGNDHNDEGESVIPDPKSEVTMEDLVGHGYKNQGAFLKSILLKPLIKMSSITRKDGSSFGGDRQSLSLKTDEINMIMSIAPLNPNTVVTLVCGSMIMTKEWDYVVPSILYGWYAGMEGGNALARVLFGDVNPSGKLPFTIPTSEKHLPYFSSTDDDITYGLYHGYTLLDRSDLKPAYAFGYGLSYTIYEYSNMTITKTDEIVNISVTVKNIGALDGEEIVQAYVGMKNSTIERQKKLLKGFEKVFILAGTSVDVVISVRLRDLMYYSTGSSEWQFESGIYEFMAGPSSEDDKLIKVEYEL